MGNFCFAMMEGGCLIERFFPVPEAKLGKGILGPLKKKCFAASIAGKGKNLLGF